MPHKSKTQPRTLFVVPARFGSKGIPRKCVRPLAGKPLAFHVIDKIAAEFGAEHIVLSTDDEQLRRLSLQRHPKLRAAARPPELADDTATLDQVVYHLCTSDPKLQTAYDYVVTVQATSPLLRSETLALVCEEIWAKQRGCVMTAQAKRKLTWRLDEGVFKPNYVKRVNRQELPAVYEETGAVVACRMDALIETGTRLNAPISLVTTEELESIDIDSHIDWSLAEQILGAQKMAFVVIGSHKNGTGHVYRALTIANEFPTRVIRFFVRAGENVAREIIKRNNYPVSIFDNNQALFEALQAFKPKTILNDTLETELAYVLGLKQTADIVINFEDLGAGAKAADAVINELYPPAVLGANAYSGPHYACLRPEFLYRDLEPLARDGILLTFGGTDPNNLTKASLTALAASPYLRAQRLVVVLGPGYKSDEDIETLCQHLGFEQFAVHRSVNDMAHLMNTCLVAISSAGRTIYELAACRLAICAICQNGRELSHLYANAGNGIQNFGLHSEVDWQSVTAEVEKLLKEPDYRQQIIALLDGFKPEEGLRNVLNVIKSLEQSALKMAAVSHPGN